MASVASPRWSHLCSVLALWAIASRPGTVDAAPTGAHHDSPIHSYAALGDSYAAGAGAGVPQSFRCGLYSDAYPVQVAHHSRLNVADADFANLACGGAACRSVLYDQVPHIGNADLVSITVGGNEVDFFVVVNECIYHWHPFSTCEAAVVQSRKLIEAPALRNHFEALVAGASQRLKPGARLLVTGYARFFNDQTEMCDHATFSRTRPLDYLTTQKRKTLNQLVVMINDVIRAAVEVHGATYVDIDAVFHGHRFCEDGVHEPDLERPETWFFNLPRVDMGTILRPHTSEGQPALDRLDRLDRQDWLDIKTWRVLHPTSLGHQAIADEIVRQALRR